MTDAKLDDIAWKARDIIANGCGCDQHECKGMVGADVRCGCKDDADAILALFRAATAIGNRRA